jgi:hypothetical protein
MNFEVIGWTLVWVFGMALAGLSCLPVGALMLIVFWPLPLAMVLFAIFDLQRDWLAWGAVWMWLHTQSIVYIIDASALSRRAYYPEDYPRPIIGIDFGNLAARAGMWSIYATWWAAIAGIIVKGKGWA